MKNEIRLALLCLAVASVPAMAQNTTDSRCGSTNYDRSRDIFTITNPALGTVTQQCFITVVPKESWSGGVPDLSSSQLVEGNYEITLSGGGGGGGGGGGAKLEQGSTQAGGGGSGGYSAIPVTTVRYLTPGVYRMTIGAGGQGGMHGWSSEQRVSVGGRGADGGPTSLSNAYSGETVAGYSGAESWDGRYPMVALGYAGAPAASGERGTYGAGGGGGREAESGAQGGHGFIKLALKDPVTRAAPMQAAPAASSASDSATTPAPAATRPARKDRN